MNNDKAAKKMIDSLWAPWRGGYVRAQKRSSCVFCVRRTGDRAYDTRHYIVRRKRRCFAMLNAYPYNNGHVLVSPYRHVSTLTGLSAVERSDLLGLTVTITEILDDLIRPHGYNIGMNVGKAAGAGFAGHLHMHIVPRWEGDTNFMPVVGRTKVIPDALAALYKAMKG